MSASTAAPFSPLNDLERLLMGVRGGGQPAREAFETALMDAPLYAAAPAGDDDGGEMVKLLSVDAGDVRATALFTAPERIAAVFGDRARAVSYPGRQLIAMVRGNPAVLNPGQAYGVRWSPEALSALIGQPAPSRAARTPSRLTTPLDIPADLVAALREQFTAEPAVQAAWLAIADYPGSLDKALYLDVRAEPGAVQIERLMRRALDGRAALALPFDVAVSPPSDRSGIGVPIVARG